MQSGRTLPVVGRKILPLSSGQNSTAGGSICLQSLYTYIYIYIKKKPHTHTQKTTKSMPFSTINNFLCFICAHTRRTQKVLIVPCYYSAILCFIFPCPFSRMIYQIINRLYSLNSVLKLLSMFCHKQGSKQVSASKWYIHSM